MGLNYFANIYLSSIKIIIEHEIINDFIKCLENSFFSGIGLRIQ